VHHFDAMPRSRPLQHEGRGRADGNIQKKPGTGNTNNIANCRAGDRKLPYTIIAVTTSFSVTLEQSPDKQNEFFHVFSPYVVSW